MDFVGPNLQNGIATLTVRLPDNCDVGDTLRFVAVVNDPTLLRPYKNVFIVDVKEEVQTSGGKGGRRKPPSGEKGADRETPAGIALPNIIPIYEADWPTQNPPFDKYTALRLGITDVSDNGSSNNGDRHDVHDFKINMDNLFFKSELKDSPGDADLLRARWKYGLVLVGLALLHDDVQRQELAKASENEDEENGPNIEKRVEAFTKAISPVLLPMISALGNPDTEPAMASSTAGEMD